MQRNLGRPKDLKKRQAILEAAKDLFLELGYDGSSMDAIAQRAGVSKLTVYSHFNDKAQLFSFAIEMVCEHRLPKHLYHLDEQTDIEQCLSILGLTFLNMIYSVEAMKLTQLMSSLVSTNIDIVHLFYNAGPERTRRNMYAFFEQVRAYKLLEIDNSQQAAELFISLLTDCEYDRVIWKIVDMPTLEQKQNMIKDRLKLFFRVYPKPIS